ncbi:hypothetical protein Tco_0377599 [Tanacetum coccineum]
MSPTPSFEKVGKKKKSQTVTKPKPKSQGPEASRVPSKETKGKQHDQIKNSTLKQSKLNLTKQKVPSKDTDTSQSVSTGQNLIPKTQGETNNPFIWDCLPHKPIRTFANPIDPKYLEENIQPADKGLPATNPDEDSDDELKELSDDDVFEAGEEMDDAFPIHTDEESQPPPYTENPSIESQHVEPTSIEHQSPTPDKAQHKSSKSKKAKKHMKFDQSPETSNSESSSSSMSFKCYDNYMPVTERVMSRNLQGLTRIENTQETIQFDMATLKTDTSNIKAMGEKSTPIISNSPFCPSPKKLAEESKETSSRPEGSKVIWSLRSPKKQRKVRQDLDAPILIDYEIEGKIYKITHEELPDHMDKKDKLEKVIKEADLSKHVIIKVAVEVVSEAEVEITGSKEFLKHQDGHLKILTRAYNEKLKKKDDL